MTTQKRKAFCGAATRRGHACRNPASPKGGFCRLHGDPSPSSARRAAGDATGAEPGGAMSSLPSIPPPVDPLQHLELLQDAALRRALAVHLAEEEAVPEDKKDAAFARNVRLAATIARLRLALSKAGEEGKAAAGTSDETPQAELVVYRLPDNGR